MRESRGYEQIVKVSSLPAAGSNYDGALAYQTSDGHLYWCNGSVWVDVSHGIPAGLGTSDSPQFAAIELGAESDTTLSRSAAGKLAVEGIDVCLLSGAQTLTGKTLTTPAISTPTMTGTIIEDVYQITDGAAFEVDPANGSVQYITLGAARTPKGTNFNAGQCVTVLIDDGSAYALTWTDSTFGTGGVSWLNTSKTAPTLQTTGYTCIVLFKIGSQVYGMCGNPG